MVAAARDPLADAVRASWQRFLDTYEPLRPDLYRYCRQLTRSPWDAEDMAQEALARAFAALGTMGDLPRNPKAWLFRVASNVWINRARQAREHPTAFDEELGDPVGAIEPRVTREAAGTLLGHLSPQERAALVLKDAFDLTLDEIAEALSTTAGAIKAALHRGRGKLDAPSPEPTPSVRPDVLDAFCAAFNARDLDRLTALLLDRATMEYPGFKIEAGADAVRDGSLRGTLFGCPDGHPLPGGVPRCELRAHHGEWVLLWWVGDEVHSVVRVDVEDGRVARLRSYYHVPEVLTDVCEALGLPFRTHGYKPE